MRETLSSIYHITVEDNANFNQVYGDQAERHNNNTDSMQSYDKSNTTRL